MPLDSLENALELTSTVFGFLCFVVVFGIPAAFLLCLIDRHRHSSAVRVARRHLLAQDDMSKESFLSRPSDNPSLLLETRNAIARYFGIPADKIHRANPLLSSILKDTSLEPNFQFGVIDIILASRNIESVWTGFQTSGLAAIDDLAESIGKAIERIKHNQHETKADRLRSLE